MFNNLVRNPSAVSNRQRYNLQQHEVPGLHNRAYATVTAATKQYMPTDDKLFYPFPVPNSSNAVSINSSMLANIMPSSSVAFDNQKEVMKMEHAAQTSVWHPRDQQKHLYTSQATEAGRVYSCKLCAYQTRILTNVQNHQRIHTNEKPFQCSFCAYKSNQHSNLKTHVKKHHEKRNESQPSGAPSSQLQSSQAQLYYEQNESQP